MAAKIRDDLEAPASPGLDAYTGLLIVSLVATLVGLIFLFLDYSSFQSKPPAVTKAAVSAPQQAPQAATPGAVEPAKAQ
jgi:hypothetical protein